MPLSQASIDNTNIHIIGLFLNLILTGFYLHVFIDCMIILIRRRVQLVSSSRWLIIASILIFLVTTIDTSVLAAGNYRTISFKAGKCLVTQSDGNIDDQSNPLSAIPNGLLVIGMLITDGIMVFRTYSVWESKLAIAIFPAMLWMACIGVAVWTFVVSLTGAATATTLVQSEAFTAPFKSVIALTFSVNFICAALISRQVYRLTFDSQLGKTRMSKVMDVVIQSAGVYCAILLVIVITIALESNAFFVVLDCLMPSMAIVFSLLIIRLSQVSTSTTTNRTMRQSTIRFEAGNVDASDTDNSSILADDRAISIAVDIERGSGDSGSAHNLHMTNSNIEKTG